MATKPPVPDWLLAYQQTWPEMRRPLAGTTFPEWTWGLFAPTVAAAVIVPHTIVVDFAVDRAANY